MIRINRLAAKTLLLLMTSGLAHAAAQDPFSLYLQSTYVEQETMGFRDPYHGPNSLTPNSGRETLDITAFAGSRLWVGAEFPDEREASSRIPDRKRLSRPTTTQRYAVGYNLRWIISTSVPPPTTATGVRSLSGQSVRTCNGKWELQRSRTDWHGDESISHPGDFSSPATGRCDRNAGPIIEVLDGAIRERTRAERLARS